ncbi:TraB/GumN family protein [Flavobacterium reichenbachii]|uniref:Polysaccharide biosynthesis protein GumN n=1 Tax=Flavobacterium reichenbachii TaxID=362418 RepID=A0A085ZT36_9FLAO|nr:TraB/GumN family protein [Flavobacterium reichenbachii]KFF07600.1 polysaccharide biosynthesis protein GumN [Flavobacterium reichenbachii]OXB14242.1 TraB/GumN family protein [Flavobacterium reichenbachii]
MKNLFTSAIAVIVLVFNGTAQAQTKSPKLENSLLWEVSGNGLTKPSYVYGTIHGICPSDYFMAEKTKSAFQKSDKLILEVNISDPNELAEAQKAGMGSEPLSKKLTPEQLSKVDAILQKNTGIKVKQLDSFTLAAIMGFISIKTFDCETLKSYESDFIDLAKKENKTIEGLETVKVQSSMLANAYTDSELIETVESFSKAETKKMVEDYKSENVMNLYNANENIMSKNAKKWILDDRNKNWIQKMPGMMKKESLFVAVGSGHLAGDEGVINLLRKAGYSVKPVTN